MIHVAVGVVINAENQILVAQRHADADHGGLWEFPGGKVEPGEDVYEALCRELQEEVQLHVIAAKPLIKIPHEYKKYKVLLDTWVITSYSGEVCGAEGQIVRWINFDLLKELTMPAANQKIIAQLYPIMR